MEHFLQIEKGNKSFIQGGITMIKRSFIYGKWGFLISILFFIVIWIIGCADNPVTRVDDKEDRITYGKIIVSRTGGIAGISKTVSMIENKDSVTIIFDEHSERFITKISRYNFNKLLDILESNGVFTLKTNVELQEKVKDGLLYEFKIQKGKKQNHFFVYEPDLLAEYGEPRYESIIKAIEELTKIELDSKFIIADMPIEDVSVLLLESFPVQVHIIVKGILSDGCTKLNKITQKREGNTIYVHITTKRPKDAFCIEVIKPFEEKIILKGGFLPGKYKLVVNNFEKIFEVQ